MSLTVAQALSLEPLKNCRLLAGKKGLDNPISHVTVMDTPDIKDWVRGGELVLSNVFVIRDDPDAQVQLVADLAEQGVAALGIKLHRFVEAVPQAMLDSADELALPLLEVPHSIPWIDVINPVLTEVLNRQLALLHRSNTIHHRFTQIALAGGSLTDIMEQLSQLLEVKVGLLSSAWQLLAGDEDRPWADLFERLPSGSGEGLEEYELPDGQYLVMPVTTSREVLASLMSGPWEDEADPLDRTAMEHAATVAALEILKQRAIQDAERRFWNRFLFDLLHGNIGSRETLDQRAHFLGFDIQRSYAVALMDLGGFSRLSLDERGQNARALRERVVSGVRTIVGRWDGAAVMSDFSESITILLPVDAHDDRTVQNEVLRERGQELQYSVAQLAPGLSVSLAMGRVYSDLLQVSHSFNEAKRVRELAHAVWGSGKITLFDDLGAFRLLYGHADRREMEAFYQEIIYPIVAYDRKRGSDLVLTLETYFRCQQDVRETSRQLYVHVNTVRYRLRRIESLTGLSLSDSEQCLCVQLGLKVRRLLVDE